MSTESDHPVFRASSAFEKGKLDIKEYGKKSTQFDNEGNIEMLLRTVISVNQLSICEFWQKSAKTGTKTHLKSQLHPLTNPKA